MNTSITSDAVSTGQKEQVVTVMKDAARKGFEEAVEELVALGTINKANLQRVLAQGGVLGKGLKQHAKELLAEIAENLVDRLKLISGAERITITTTDGQGTIAENGGKVFPGWVDSDFRNYGTNVKGAATAEMPVQVYQLVKNGTFAQIFGGFGENLDRLCLTQDQIMRFAQDHSKWLNKDGYANFFLFKVGAEYFVADVSWDSGGQREVYVDRVSHDCVWYGDGVHRVVVPQLTPATT